jgi:hypothetical protein
MDGTTVLTTQALQGGGCAYWYISPGLTAGTHTLSAFYAGDANNPYGWSPAVTASVQPVPVTLSASCWNSSFPYGANYQCTVNASSNAGAAQGAITYAYDSNADSAVQLVNGGTQFAIDRPGAGQHTVKINYTRQGNYAAAGPSAQVFTVTPAPVNVSVTPSAWSATVGMSLTVTASVTSWSAGPPNGNGVISFYDGSSLLGQVPVDSSGSSAFGTSILSAGNHTITAAFSNGTNYANGLGSATITITQ